MKPEVDDELRALAHALRETKRGESSAPDKTRAAVLRAQAERGKARGVWLAAAAVLITLVSVPSAWAFYTGYLAPETHARPESSEAMRAPMHVSLPSPRPTVEAPLAMQVQPEVSLEQAEHEATQAQSPSTQPHRVRTSRPLPSPGLQHEVAIDPAERHAYEEAHALHFDAHDAAGALTAWDAYLARYPEGRFAPEARYNRALSLVRLGRRDQAIEALHPFAAGAFGTYRAREAQALLDALSEAP